MGLDLPSIKGRAEFDLALFRQQAAEIQNILRQVATDMRAVPSARIQVDVLGVRETARAVEQTTREIRRQTDLQAQFERDHKRQMDALDRQVRNAMRQRAREQAAEEFQQLRRVAEEHKRQWDLRLRVEQEARRQQRAEAQREAQEARRQAREARSMQFRTGFAAIAGAGVLAGVERGVADQINQAADALINFERAMAQVRAVLSPAELQQSAAALEQLALTLGRGGLGFSAVEAARALEEMAKAGLTVQQMMQQAPSVLALAAAGNISVADAAKLAASAMTVFRQENITAAQAANVFAGIANATVADINDLRLGFQQVSAVAELSNQSFKDTALALGVLAQAGIRGSDAGTSLRTMLLRLIPQSTAAAAVMNQFGLIVGGVNRFVDQSTGKFKSFSEIADILQQAFANASDSQRQFALRVIFGQDAVRAATVLLRAGAAGFRQLEEAASQTTALDVARERLNSLAGDLQNLNSMWNQVQIAFGKQLEPGTRPLVQAVTELLDSIRQLPPEVQRTLAVLLLIGDQAVKVTAVVIATAGALKVMGLSAGAAAASIAALALPIAAVSAAVAAVAVVWTNNWFGIRDRTIEVVKAILTELQKFREGLELVGEAVGNFTQRMQRGVGSALSNLADLIHPQARELGAKLGESLAEALAQAYIETLKRALVIPATIDMFNQLTQAAREERQRIRREQEQEQLREQHERISRGERLTPEQRLRNTEELAAQLFERIGRANVDALVAEVEAFFRTLPDRARDDAIQAYQELVADIHARVAQLLADLGVQASDDIIGKIVNSLVQRGRAELPRAVEALTHALIPTGQIAAMLLQQTGGDFAQAIAQAGAGPGAEEVIRILIEQERAVKTLSKAIEDDLDPVIAAHIQVLRNQATELKNAALVTTNYEQAQRLLAESAAIAARAEELAAAHIAAAAQTRADARALERLEQEKLEASQKLFEERVRSLIDATMPALNAAQLEQIRILQLEGQWWQALSVAVAAVGGDLTAIASAISGSNAQLELQAAQLRQLAQASDPAVRALELTRQVMDQFLTRALEGLPAVQRAQLEFAAATQGPMHAVRMLWQQLGLDIQKLPDITEATTTTIQRLLRQIEARKFFLETGELLPASKVLDASEQFREAAFQAEQNIIEARERIAAQLEEVRRRWQEGVDRAARTLAEAFRDFQRRLAEIREDLDVRLAEINRQIAKEIREFQRRLAELAEREQELRAEFARAVAKRREEFTREQAEQMRQFQQQVDDARRQIAQAVADAVKQQREQLMQLSQQLADLRAREAAQARVASERLSDLALKELLATTAEERSKLAQERIRLQAEQGEQATALQREITRGQSGLHQTLEGIQERLLAQISEQIRSQTEQLRRLQEQQQQATREFAEQMLEARRTFEKQLKQLQRQREDLERQHAERLLELQLQRAEAKRQAEKQEERAKEAFRDAKRRHEEQVNALNAQREADEKRLMRELNAAERRHQEQLRRADRALQLAEQQAGFQRSIQASTQISADALTEINHKLDRVRPQVVINMANMNVEEGDVEFLERAAEQALELVQQPLR